MDDAPNEPVKAESQNNDAYQTPLIVSIVSSKPQLFKHLSWPSQTAYGMPARKTLGESREPLASCGEVGRESKSLQ